MIQTKLSHQNLNPPTFFAIAACDPEGVIGLNGKLPWQNEYLEDLAHFRNLTDRQIVIMGRKTYEEIPLSIFKTRHCYVFTRTGAIDSFLAQPLGHIKELERFYKSHRNNKTSWVIGGGEIFELFLKENLIKAAVITHLKKRYDGDVRFPLHYLKEWSQELVEETPLFSIVRYENPTF